MLPFCFAVTICPCDGIDESHLGSQAYFMGIGLFGNDEETWIMKKYGKLVVYFLSNRRDLNKICKLYEDLDDTHYERVNMWRSSNDAV